jgi:hypothetical protein
MSNPRVGQKSNYTISFVLPSTGTIKSLSFGFRTTASTGSAVPDALTTKNTDADETVVAAATINGTDVAAWEDDFTTDGTVIITDATGIVLAAPNAPVVVTINNITNQALGDCASTSPNAETCYLRIRAYSTEDGAGTMVDSGVTTFTATDAVTVTATVDPTLTFTVGAVADTAITTNDSYAIAGDKVTSTATACSFGNLGLTVGKLCQQSVSVRTNAQNGYSVYHKFSGADPALNLMEGTYAGNNLDPFTSTFGSPGAFTTAPAGTAKNVNSGLVGIRSTGASGFNANNTFGAPYVGTSSGNVVKSSTGPDDGTAAAYVTLKVWVNSFQPADTYTGTAVYNVVASY